MTSKTSTRPYSMIGSDSSVKDTISWDRYDHLLSCEISQDVCGLQRRCEAERFGRMRSFIYANTFVVQVSGANNLDQ